VSELATAKDQDPLGPQGPQTPSVEWLILQRLEDLRRAQDDLRRAQDDLHSELKALDAKMATQINALEAKLEAKIDSLRNGSLGLLLLAIVGLLAKLLIPGA